MSNSRNLADLLDANGDVSLGDNVKAKFGASDDLQIYSVGNTSYIHETGSGDFYIKGSSIYVTDSSNNQFIHCNDTGTGGTVSLKHGGSTKLNTTATGIDVTGSVTCYGLDLGNSQYISLKNSSNVSTRSFGINNVNNMYIGGIDAAIGDTLFVNNGAERMRIDSSGNVGIGTTSPAVNNKGLHINNSGANTIEVHLTNSTTGTTTGDGLSIQVDGSGDAYISQREAKDIITYTNGYERMRIDSSGNVLIGLTSSPHGGRLSVASTWPQNPLDIEVTSSNSSASATQFYFNGTYVGGINCTASSTAYATSSDYRLKENVVPMTGSIDRLKALKPSRFNFKADADKTVDGFLAHEAGEVVPECATGTKDAMKDEEYEVTPAVMDGETVVTEAVMGTRSVPDYQGIDQSKLVPLLVASLQEAIARIEQLEQGA